MAVAAVPKVPGQMIAVVVLVTTQVNQLAAVLAVAGLTAKIFAVATIVVYQMMTALEAADFLNLPTVNCSWRLPLHKKNNDYLYHCEFSHLIANNEMKKRLRCGCDFKKMRFVVYSFNLMVYHGKLLLTLSRRINQ